MYNVRIFNLKNHIVAVSTRLTLSAYGVEELVLTTHEYQLLEPLLDKFVAGQFIRYEAFEGNPPPVELYTGEETPFPKMKDVLIVGAKKVVAEKAPIAASPVEPIVLHVEEKQPHNHNLVDLGHTHNSLEALATNEANTTGITLGNTHVGVSLQDPGHEHKASNAGARNLSYRLGFHEAFNMVSEDANRGTLDQSVAASKPASQSAYLRNMEVVFPAAWKGGNVVVEGVGATGQAVSETFAKPSGGGTVVGSKVFAMVNNYTNTSPTSATGVEATVRVGTLLCVANAPVAAFVKVTCEGMPDAFKAIDLANGTFACTGTLGSTDHGNVEVWYAVDVALSITGHTHTIGNAVTGLSATDAGHTHEVVDAGHTHAQQSHTHVVEASDSKIVLDNSSDKC